MSKHTFTIWLRNEVTATRCALITLYEQRDKMKYIEAPRLENEYMNKIGSYEEPVIKAEIECELLRKKQQMIQAAINRQEPIDEAAIDAELEKERQQMLSEAAGSGAPTQFALLSPEENDELQELYREIVRNFHPQMHPELTEIQRQLFKKAQDAYKCRDITALRLIYDMLTSTQVEGIEIKFALDILVGDSLIEGSNSEGWDYSTDYALAASIYDSFRSTAEETTIKEEREKYRNMINTIMSEIEDMRTEFPFTATDMLLSPAKIEEYKESLAHRLRTATEERERRTREIRAAIESVMAHG